MAELAFLVGAFVGVYLVSRLMLFLTKRLKDSAARLPVAYSLTLIVTVGLAGYGLASLGEAPAFAEAFGRRGRLMAPKGAKSAGRPVAMRWFVEPSDVFARPDR
jgi:hypothetical protein